MFYNMMTGNIQGYEDINSQRKFENNYKFSWEDSVGTKIDDVESKILQYSKAEVEISESEPLVDREEGGESSDGDEDVGEGGDDDDFYHGGDRRQRPSSLDSKIESEHSESESEGKDEL